MYVLFPSNKLQTNSREIVIPRVPELISRYIGCLSKWAKDIGNICSYLSFDRNIKSNRNGEGCRGVVFQDWSI